MTYLYINIIIYYFLDSNIYKIPVAILVNAQDDSYEDQVNQPLTDEELAERYRQAEIQEEQDNLVIQELEKYVIIEENGTLNLNIPETVIEQVKFNINGVNQEILSNNIYVDEDLDIIINGVDELYSIQGVSNKFKWR